MKLNKAGQQFKNYLENERGYSKMTIDNYMRDLRQLIEFNGFKDVEVEEIETKHIVGFLNNVIQKYSAKTRNRKAYAIKSFYKYLKKYGMVNNNPADIIEAVKVEEKTEPVYLKKNEIKKLLKTINSNNSTNADRDEAIIKTLIFTGLRVSELADLSIDNLDFEEGLIKFTGKGNKERIVPLHEEVKKAINRWLPENAEDIFNCTVRTIQRVVKKYVKKAGIDKNITPHKLRHTFASLFYHNTKDLKALQDLLGHADISTTQIYTHTDQEEKKRQVNSIKI